MTIDHIAIRTDNLERLKAYYLEFFEGTASARYTNNLTGFSSYFPVTTLPAMSAVWGLVSRKVFLLYLLFPFTGAIVFGWLYNVFQ